MDTNNMWDNYIRTKDVKVREELIIKYLYLVKFVAGRLYANYGSNVEYDDLVSYGVFGLIDAIEKYDTGRGVKFDTYAQLRIKGAIIDYLREIDWLPRSVRQKAKELEKAYFDLENELGRAATDEEVAAKLNVSVEDFQKKIQHVSTYSVVSLDDLLEQKRELVNDEDNDTSPGAAIEQDVLRNLLVETINGLPEKENKVITLYYYEELTYKEIGKLLNISESRVSQLHTKAIIRLKSKISSYLNIS